jgi:acyl-CoA thioesterase FadM
VVARCTLARVGNSSLTTREELLVGGQVAAEAEVVLVARDRENGRARPLVERERLALEREL